ncbi:hypothetical protein LZ30DRAFT_35797 [Colletotrichum cereale]|nr:hypothetical protein LZ30DRAFT_35797 [Colletotrichum cereale]
MSVDWSEWAGEITRLYVTEDKSAEETIQILRDEHNVKVTIRQFKGRYSGLKKLRANEWRAVKRVIQKRKADGKDSAVFLNNRQIDPSRLAREMRRYCGARGRDSTGDGAAIDLGIDTVDKHRLEIRTPISEFIQCPNGSPRSRDITAGNATISVEEFGQESTSEYIPDTSGYPSHFELENLDLSTPDLGTAEASFWAGPLHNSERIVNDTETHRDTSWSLQGDESTLIEGRQYQIACQSPRRSPITSTYGLNSSYPCLPSKPDHAIWSSNLSQSTFFLLPGIYVYISSGIKNFSH